MTTISLRTMLAILGVGTAGTATYFAVSNQTTTTVKPKIEVVTADSEPLIFEMGTSYVDLCFVGGAARKAERNMSDTDFLKKERDLNFFRGVYITFGSGSQYGHVALTGTGMGYNFHESDFTSRQEYLDYGGGVCCGWNSDFEKKTLGFVQALPIKCDVNLNIKNGTWAEHKKLIEDYNPDYIGFQSESVTDDGFSIEQYIAKAVPVRDSIKKYFPDKKIILDNGLPYRQNPKTLNWNSKIYAPFQNEYAGRNYIQTGDRNAYNTNQDSNIIKLINYCTNGIPADIASFKQAFPAWKIIAEEILIEDNRGDVKYLSQAANVYAWGKLYESLITHQSDIPVGYQMANKNLISGDTTMYKTLQLLNNFLHSGNQVNKITFTEMEGVSGISISDGGKQFIMINNASHTGYTLSNVVLDGTTTNKKMVFVTQSNASIDWNTQPVTLTVTSTGTFTIAGGGTTIIAFEKK